MRNVLAGCILGMFMLAPTTVWAVHPFVVEDTNVQGKGNVLFELNGDYTKDHTFKTTKLTGVFTVGTGDDTDFSLEVPYLMLNPSRTTDQNEQGLGDVQLKLKYRLYENEVNQSLGLLVYAGVPTADVDRGLGTDKVLAGFQITDQQECHSNIIRVSAGLETIGWTLSKWEFAENYAFRYGIALEHKFTESFRLLSELAGASRRLHDRTVSPRVYSQPATFMAGFRYDISKSWYVDLAGRAGLNNDAEDYTALAGTAWKF